MQAASQVIVSRSFKKSQSLVSLKKIKYLTDVCLECTPYPEWGVAIEICDDKTMKLANRSSRGKNTSTDVLSFPGMNEPVKPGKFVAKKKQPLFPHYGTIMISEPYILKYCKENDVNMSFHLPLLIVHSLLHLQHYDHETDEDADVMKYKEREMLNYLSTRINYDFSTSNSTDWDLWSNKSSKRGTSEQQQQQVLNWKQLLAI